jgi:hypothetical protein
MAKRRPSDREMDRIRARHATRAIRETRSYALGWPERHQLLSSAWSLLITLPVTSGFGPADWFGWMVLLGSDVMPRLSFDPFDDN